MNCTYDTCKRDEPLRKGYCDLHYQRYKKYGTPDGRPLVPCSGPECERIVRRNGLCDTHSAQAKRGQELIPIVPKGRKGYWIRNEQGYRTCVRCDVARPDQGFHKNARTKDGLHYYCRKCDKDMKLIRTYGITLDRYRELMAEQNNRCAVSGCDWDEIFDSPQILAVDHDHACCPTTPLVCGGTCIRALLCPRCNQVLGAVKENTRILRGLIDYHIEHATRTGTLREWDK